MTAQRCRPISILCIDDDASCLEVHKRLLEKAGYDVLESSDGERGLTLFSSVSIDLVMVDYSLPGMNGASVACAMRRQKPEVPIVMVSGQMPRPDDADSCVDAFIVKSAGFKDVLSEIERLLDKGTREEDRPRSGEIGSPRAGQDFSGLRGETRKRFEKMGLEIDYAKGERLFTEGEIQQYVFLLSSGRVKLTAGPSEGQTARFHTAQAGDLLGLNAALNAGDCEATVEALENCRVRIIYTKEFVKFLEKNPEGSLEAARCILKEYDVTLDDIRRLTAVNTAQGGPKKPARASC